MCSISCSYLAMLDRSILFYGLQNTSDYLGLSGGAHIVGGVAAIAWGVFVMLNWGEK